MTGLPNPPKCSPPQPGASTSLSAIVSFSTRSTCAPATPPNTQIVTAAAAAPGNPSFMVPPPDVNRIILNQGTPNASINPGNRPQKACLPSAHEHPVERPGAIVLPS